MWIGNYLLAFQKAVQNHDCSWKDFQITSTNNWESRDAQRRQERQQNDQNQSDSTFFGIYELLSVRFGSIDKKIICSNGFSNNYGKTYDSINHFSFLFLFLARGFCYLNLYVHKDSKIHIYYAKVEVMLMGMW